MASISEICRMLDKISRAAYNISYLEWEKLFVDSGGSKRLAKHIWTKWKLEWNDNFLYTYGNLSKDNQKHAVSALLLYAKARKY